MPSVVDVDSYGHLRSLACRMKRFHLRLINGNGAGKATNRVERDFYKVKQNFVDLVIFWTIPLRWLVKSRRVERSVNPRFPSAVCGNDQASTFSGVLNMSCAYISPFKQNE